MIVPAALTSVAVLLGCAILPSAAAAEPGPTLPVAEGVVTHPDGGGFAWRLGVARNDIGGIPGLCLMSDHSWDAEGNSFGNISTRCVAGRVGRRFSLRAGDCDGLAVAFATGSAGDDAIRKVGLAADRRAGIVRIVFEGGERVTVRARRAPRKLRLGVWVAWRMDAGAAAPRRVVAYGPKRKRAGRKHARRPVVGRWRPGTGC